MAHPLKLGSTLWSREQRSIPPGSALRCRAEAPLPSDGSVRQLSKAQMLKKLAAAKEYKSKPISTTPPTNTTSAPIVQPPPGPSPTQPETEKDNALAALDAYAAKQAADEAAEFLQAQEQFAAARPARPQQPPQPEAEPSNAAPIEDQQSSDEDERGFRRGTGNADQAATWLQTIATEGRAAQLDTNLRPEEFTARKEELQRQKGAAIERAKGVVTGTRRKIIDNDYGLAQQTDDAEASMAADRANLAAAKAAKAAGAAADAAGMTSPSQERAEQAQQEGEDTHKPAVATWGVFPRPRNISEAYGGGRNLKPGQALESEESAAERQKRVSAALLNYRKSLGLDIAPEIENQAVSLYEQGENEFKAGRITTALKLFSDSAALVPIRSKIGGQASLQKAICLDSLGYNEEAYEIYKKLEGHTGPGVSKSAKRFLFGFKAAKKLKVDTIYYGSGGVEAWQGYFDKINTGGWTEYRAKQEESEEDKESATTTTLVAAAVVLVPLALLAVAIVK